MKQRVSDLVDVEEEEMVGDFVRRQLKPGTFRLVLYSGIAFGVTILSILQVDSIGSTTLVSIVTAIFIVFIFAMLTHMDKISDVVFTNDFENALFAGVAGAGVDFLLIIKSNKHIVYYNPACREYFTYQPQGHTVGFDSLLTSLGLDEKACERVLLAFASKSRVRVSSTLLTPSGDMHQLSITLDPLTRPKGYFVLKAVKEMGVLKETLEDMAVIKGAP